MVVRTEYMRRSACPSSAISQISRTRPRQHELTTGHAGGLRAVIVAAIVRWGTCCKCPQPKVNLRLHCQRTLPERAPHPAVHRLARRRPASLDHPGLSLHSYRQQNSRTAEQQNQPCRTLDDSRRCRYEGVHFRVGHLTWAWPALALRPSLHHRHPIAPLTSVPSPNPIGMSFDGHLPG